MRITVLGTGYLGTTHAACMTQLGHEVLGVDNDPRKLEQLAAGEVPFYEPGLTELLRSGLDSGRLRFTASYVEAARFADVFFVAVGTPQKDEGLSADLSSVEAAVAALAPLLDRPAVIVGKSTVPVGTARRLTQTVRGLRPPDSNVEMAWNPEFLREGFAVEDTLDPDRIVLGVCGQPSRAEAVVRELYAQPIAAGTPLIVTDLETAELVKVSANAFLATKISFINAISEVCDAVNADVTVLADALGLDDRIGRKGLNAGLGFGGGCLPKDVRAFMARAEELGADGALTLLRAVDGINRRMRRHVVDLACEMSDGSLAGARVAVLGAAFKPNSDDVRDSPALDVAGRLQLQGAAVSVFDPRATQTAAAIHPEVRYCESIPDACKSADMVLVLTEWAEFRALDPVSLRSVVSRPVVIDGRNCLDADQWSRAGWTYRGIGRPTRGRGHV